MQKQCFSKVQILNIFTFLSCHFWRIFVYHTWTCTSILMRGNMYSGIARKMNMSLNSPLLSISFTFFISSIGMLSEWFAKGYTCTEGWELVFLVWAVGVETEERWLSDCDNDALSDFYPDFLPNRKAWVVLHQEK